MGKLIIDKYMILRMALTPVELYLDAEKFNIIDFFFTNEIFRKQILIAHPDIYEFILSKNKEELLNNKKVFTLLNNFFKRSCTRATPFGMFSGITKATLDKKTCYKDSFYENYHMKLDYGWVLAYLKIIEKEQFHNLKVTTNKDTYCKGKRIIPLYNTDFLKSTKSIEKTEAVIRIQEYCKEPKFVKDCIEFLSKYYETNDYERVKNFLWNLTENGFLISSLRFSIHDEKLLHSLLENCNNSRFLNISKQIEKKFSNIPIEKIQSDMMDLCKSNEYLFVNTLIENMDFCLGQKLGDDIINALEHVWNLFGESNWNKNEDIILYTDFVETYGLNNMVSAIDYYFIKDISKKDLGSNTHELDEIYNIMLNKYEDTLKDGTYDINIADILGFNNKADMPEFYDVYGEIFKDQNGKEEFVINSLLGNYTYGASFGRFIKELPDVEDYICNYYQSQDIIYAQLDFFPNDEKIAFILDIPCLMDFKLSLNIFGENKYDLPLNDIYIVALENNKLCLWSKKYNKEVIIVAPYFINDIYYPPIYSFLLSICSQTKTRFNFQFLGQIKILCHIPRIRYNNIILSKEKWKLSKGLFDSNNWVYSFKSVCKKYNIPQYVYFCEADMKIVINTKYEEDIVFLKKKLEKKNLLIIEEVYKQFKNNFICKQQKHYVHELAVPIINRTKLNNLSSLNIREFISKPLTYKDGYIYFKIYAAQNNENKIITDYLFLLYTNLCNAKKIKRMFFIRYHDVFGSHIRVRFLNILPQNIGEVILEIDSLRQDLLDAKLASNIVFDTFVPEYNRYGGVINYEIIEKYFCNETELVVDYLRNIDAYPLKKVFWAYYFLSLCRVFFTDYNEVRTLFSCKYYGYSDEIREIKKDIKDMCEGKKYSEDISKIKKRIHHLNALNFNEINVDERKRIVSSLIHMTCNRLTFKGRQFEEEMLEILRFTITSLKYWECDIWQKE